MLLLCGNIFSQAIKYKIFFDDYNLTIIRTTKLKSFVTYKIDNGYVKIMLLTKKGESLLEEYNKDSVLVKKGQYVGSLDLLKSYAISVDPNPPYSEKVYVYAYYEPLKTGKWFYYSNDKIIKEEIWEKGILISTKIY